MGRYWLMDRHGAEGPSVLVEMDGSMRVVDVLAFGPDVTELADQQTLRDDVIGRIAPTMRPFIAAAKVAEKGIAVHADLQHRDTGGNRLGSSIGGGQGVGAGRGGRGAKRTGGRGRG